jgi:hypothetical protein
VESSNRFAGTRPVLPRGVHAPGGRYDGSSS